MSNSILVFIQHHSGKVLKASLCALAAAIELKKVWSKGDLVALCCGEKAAEAGKEISTHGVAKVLVCEDGALEKYLATSYSAVLEQALGSVSADTIVGAATSTGKDLFPRLAALIDAGQASDITGVNADGSLKRPMYAGNVFADVEIISTKKVVTVRGTAFSPAPGGSAPAPIEPFKADLTKVLGGEVVSYELSKSSRPELGDAEIVVSGGRAMQSSENFEKYIFPLADALGAAVGASRAAVDSGYAPNDWQVGQTGKVVAPNVYVAIGISGAIQHLAGMKDSKVIVAINKDPDAPIYEVADYGLVADLFDVVPKLTAEIKKVKQG